MNYLANKLVNYLIANEITSADMRQIHVYGFEVIFGKILNYGTLLLLSYINGNMIQTLLFMTAFFTLRGRTGGYHARSAAGCYFGTIMIFFFISGLAVPFLVNHTCVIWGSILFSLITIFVLSPIDHPDLGLCEQEIKKCRESSRVLAVLIAIAAAVLMLLEIDRAYVGSVVAGMGLDAGLILLSKMRREKKDEASKRDGFEECSKNCRENG